MFQVRDYTSMANIQSEEHVCDESSNKVKSISKSTKLRKRFMGLEFHQGGVKNVDSLE